MRRKSFKEVLDAHRGVGPGFDLLRILLALAIFYGHAKWASGHGSAEALRHSLSARVSLEAGGWEGWRRPLLTSYVPAFFALSGFLVTGSALRTRVTSTFLAFRALRIFPALTVELLLSAFLLGAAVTTVPLAQYFTSPVLLRYFGNLFGWITFSLPGVFTTNPAAGVVNANLWTLPSEFDCYLITAFLMTCGLFYRRAVLTIAFAAVTLVFLVLNTFTSFGVTASTLPGFAITYYFFTGVLFYHWREYIPLRRWLFVLAAVLSYVLQYGHHAVFLAPVFVAYCTLAFGMISIPRLPLLASGDYSYGIYLYGFPITQAVVALVPGMRGSGWGTLLVSLLVTCIFAAFSWHAIEKPTLQLKRKLPSRYFPQKRADVPITPSLREATVSTTS